MARARCAPTPSACIGSTGAAPAAAPPTVSGATSAAMLTAAWTNTEWGRVRKPPMVTRANSNLRARASSTSQSQTAPHRGRARTNLRVAAVRTAFLKSRPHICLYLILPGAYVLRCVYIYPWYIYTPEYTIYMCVRVRVYVYVFPLWQRHGACV